MNLSGGKVIKIIIKLAHSHPQIYLMDNVSAM